MRMRDAELHRSGPPIDAAHQAPAFVLPSMCATRRTQERVLGQHVACVSCGELVRWAVACLFAHVSAISLGNMPLLQHAHTSYDRAHTPRPQTRRGLTPLALREPEQPREERLPAMLHLPPTRLPLGASLTPAKKLVPGSRPSRQRQEVLPRAATPLAASAVVPPPLGGCHTASRPCCSARRGATNSCRRQSSARRPWWKPLPAVAVAASRQGRDEATAETPSRRMVSVSGRWKVDRRP